MVHMQSFKNGKGFIGSTSMANLTPSSGRKLNKIFPTDSDEMVERCLNCTRKKCSGSRKCAMGDKPLKENHS